METPVEIEQGYDSFLNTLTAEELQNLLASDTAQDVIYATQRPDYDTTGAPSATNPDWMSKIPDSVAVTALSIPGAHNTVSLYGGPWAQCQSWSLMDIYLSGVRFVDIRCRHFNDTLPIHHEIMYQKTNFRNVLGETLRFLDSHPTETILMRVRKEYKAENNTRSFEDLVNEHLDRYLPSHRRWEKNYLPKLGEARGKLIFLRDYGDSRWIHFRILDIDDKWDVPSLFHVGTKWTSVVNHLEKAKNGSAGVGYLTFTSGSSALAFPYAVANRINSRLWEYLQKENGKVRWGMIAMDFPGVGLIKAIINSNF